MILIKFVVVDIDGILLNSKCEIIFEVVKVV